MQKSKYHDSKALFFLQIKKKNSLCIKGYDMTKKEFSQANNF